MGISIPTFTAGTTVAAADLRNKIATAEEFVNGGIVAGDLQTTPDWVDCVQIYKPDFYGSPSPRIETVSGDLYYRFYEDSRLRKANFHADLTIDKPVGVPGLCATVRNPDDDDKRILVVASWYAYENGGYQPGQEQYEVGFFDLRLNGASIAGTARSIYNTGNTDPTGRRQYSCVSSVVLTPGTHQIGVHLTVNVPTFLITGIAPYDYAAPSWKHVFIQARGFTVNVPSLQT